MKVIATEKIPVKMCKCGCGNQIEPTDKYGRSHDYISGHNGRKYKDPTQYKREWNHRNRKSRYESKVERGHRLKVKVINLMGGKCSNPNCNLKYNGKNACVFQTHHKDPKQKEFVINTRTLINYSWKKILREIKKCELLCANCHFIKENEEY
jgi:hypothetical protein